MEYKGKILIADDDMSIVQSLTDLLADDYKVNSVVNGKDVISYLNKINFNIDLLLLDIMMPQMDGFSV